MCNKSVRLFTELRQGQRSARIHHVGMGDGRCLGNFVDADFIACRKDSLNDLVGPIGAVAEQAEVAKGLLGTAQLALALAQQV